MRNYISRKSTTYNPTFCSGFTLVELLVVISLIILVSGIALPSISKIFTSGADTQAFSMLAAQIAMARGQALKYQTYAGIHVQMADTSARPDSENTCYTAIIMGYDHDNDPYTSPRFRLAEGHQPIALPGSIAAGGLDYRFMGANVSNAYSVTDDNRDDFTSFSVVFDDQGQITKYVFSADYSDRNFVIFDDPSSNANPLFQGDTKLWNYDLTKYGSDPGEPGVMGITIFDYATFIGLEDEQARNKYLEANAPLLGIDIYTGQLFYRY